MPAFTSCLRISGSYRSHLQGIHHWNVARHTLNWTPQTLTSGVAPWPLLFWQRMIPPTALTLKMLFSYAGSTLHFWLSPLNKAYFVQCPFLTDWGGGTTQTQAVKKKNLRQSQNWKLSTQWAINSPSVWKSIKADILSFTYLSLKQHFLVSCENPRNLECHKRWAPLQPCHVELWEFLINHILQTL